MKGTRIPLLPICALCLSLFFFWAWYERYLKWDFNDLGRYYDAESETVYTTSGFVWAIPAFLFLMAGARGLYGSVRRAKKLHR